LKFFNLGSFSILKPFKHNRYFKEVLPWK